MANKFKFKQLLSEYLKYKNIKVEVATKDVDTSIVNKGLQLKSMFENVCIVGIDVNLLVVVVVSSA